MMVIVDEAGFNWFTAPHVDGVVIFVDVGDTYDVIELENEYQARLAVRYFKPY